MAAGTGSLALNLLPALPGVRQEKVTVYANSELSGRSVTYTKEITVVYTVADNPAVDFVFSPPQLDLTFRYGDPLIHETPYRLVVRPGISMAARGVDYLSSRLAASGHQQANVWFDNYFSSFSATPCYNGINCLPLGTYTARVHHTMTKGGVDTEVYYPVTMQIVP